MAGTPKRSPSVEAALHGRAPTQQVFEDAAKLLANDFQPLSDMRASADYRLRACAGILIGVSYKLGKPGPGHDPETYNLREVRP